MQKIDKPLLPEVVFMYGQEWKRTPGYINTYINKEGEIRLLNSNNDLIKTTQFEWKTTKGTYKYLKVINNDFIPVNKAVHQLVCLTYNGSPPQDGNKYEPNHIDGDKHNNRPDNLEWTTRSSNVQHSFDTGLCTGGIRIEAHNNVTGETRKYNSFSSMARDWNMSRQELRNIILLTIADPEQSNWSFKIDNSSDKQLNRYQNRTVVCRDYELNTLTIYDNSMEASFSTGVKPETILNRLGLDKLSPSYNKLLSKYIFRTTDDKLDWPNYTIEDAIQSKISYINSIKTVRPSRK